MAQFDNSEFFFIREGGDDLFGVRDMDYYAAIFRLGGADMTNAGEAIRRIRLNQRIDTLAKETKEIKEKLLDNDTMDLWEFAPLFNVWAEKEEELIHLLTL